MAKRRVVRNRVLEYVFANPGFTPEAPNQLVIAATPVLKSSDPVHLDRVAERVLCSQRPFTVREGFGHEATWSSGKM